MLSRFSILYFIFLHVWSNFCSTILWRWWPGRWTLPSLEFGSRSPGDGDHHHHHRDHHHESDEDDVKKESEQLFISSASKVAQDDAAAEEEKSNQDKTRGERSSVALDIFFLEYYLLVSRHITEPNDFEPFLSLINLSSPRPCCQFDDCLTEACWQHFVFIFLFWLGKIRLRFDVAVLHLGIFWPIFHFKGCVFSCPGQLNSDGDLDWIAFAILAMFVFLRGNCFFIGVSGSSENWTNRFSQGSKFLVHGAHWCNIKHVF